MIRLPSLRLPSGSGSAAAARLMGRFLGAVVLLATALAGARPALAQVPAPIDPNRGEQRLIDLIDSLPIQRIPQALDRLPLPYALVVSAGGAPPTVINPHAGAPVRVDADRSRETGLGGGGQDLQVRLDTELLPVPHLLLEIERLGTAPFAEDLTLLVAAPWNGFNDETFPDRPNLFFGFQTTAPFDAFSQTYPAGGSAPSVLRLRWIPGVLAGLDHDVELRAETEEPRNPLRLLAGFFDGTVETGIQNATALGAHVDPVPSRIVLGLDVRNTPVAQASYRTAFGLDWLATARARVTFDYLENESFPFDAADFATSLRVDRMPTVERLGLVVDTAAREAILDHQANASIGAVTLRHRRPDALTVVAEATDVPTTVSLTLDLAGSVALDVDADTLDLHLQAVETLGFPGSGGFFGLAYDLDYLGLRLVDAPDLTAGFSPATNGFVVEATHPEECPTCDTIDLVELVLDDDGRLGPGDVPLFLSLPTSWTDAPIHHILSVVDDGVHGTAAARAVQLREGKLVLEAPSVGQSVAFDAGAAAPMQSYLRTSGATTLFPGRDLEVTCDLDVLPSGPVETRGDLPERDQSRPRRRSGPDPLLRAPGHAQLRRRRFRRARRLPLAPGPRR